MILDPDFLTHWKTQALIGAIGAGPALTAILGLWGHCQTRKEWEFALTPRMLAGICRFTGDAEMLLAEMVTCGFLDHKNDLYEVHGWAEKNAQLLSAWRVGKSGGRPPKNPRVSTNAENAPSSNPTDNPQQTHGPPDKIRVDKSREESVNDDPSADAIEPPAGENSAESDRRQQREAWQQTTRGAFDAFWDAYPRKVARQKALAAFTKGKLAAMLPQILAALAIAKRSWEGKEAEFIPHAATWLNGRRWEDEIPSAGGQISALQKKGGGLPAIEHAKLSDPDLPEPGFDWRATMREMFDDPDTSRPWGTYQPSIRREVEAFEAGKKERGAA